MTSNEIAIYGVDPAPRKGLVIWSKSGPDVVKPLDASDWMENLVKKYEYLLIAWDAPISFNRKICAVQRYSQRPVEKVMSEFFREPENKKKFDKSIAVRHFSGLPHWTITCDLLGLPFMRASAPSRFAIPPSSDKIKSLGRYVIEVHPAVTLAMWWIKNGTEDPMPKYKYGDKTKNLTPCRQICETLSLPEVVLAAINENPRICDDILDAYVAFSMAEGFKNNESQWVGDFVNGGFVLPKSAEVVHGLNTKVKKKTDRCAKRAARALMK